MRKPSRRGLAIGLAIIACLAVVPALFWVSLTHTPNFYRTIVAVPRARQKAEAKRFVAQSLQLRNDIHNEPVWEAVFSDQEVNAWLAEDLVTHFADQLPPEVHEPRVVFEADRVTLAFGLDQGPVRSVIWVVARPYVPEGNVLELTIEKIRAGVLPIPAETTLDRVTAHARARGLDVAWKRDGEFPVAVIRFTPHSARDDVQLERINVQPGQIRLAGRSDGARGLVRRPTLPTRQVLQSKFPKRTLQVPPPAPPGTPSASSEAPSEAPPTATALRNSSIPAR